MAILLVYYCGTVLSIVLAEHSLDRLWPRTQEPYLRGAGVVLQAQHVLVTESGRSSVELVDSCLARGKVLLVLTLLLIQISLDLKCA